MMLTFGNGACQSYSSTIVHIVWQTFATTPGSHGGHLKDISATVLLISHNKWSEPDFQLPYSWSQEQQAQSSLSMLLAVTEKTKQELY